MKTNTAMILNTTYLFVYRFIGFFVFFDTKGSIRWTLAINADEIEDFTFKGTVLQLCALFDLAVFALVFVNEVLS